MADSVSARSRSGGYFKLYMFVWTVAAAAALAYLASLVTNPELSKSVTQQTPAEPEQSLRLASRALSEVGTVRRSVGELQRDIGQIKENIEQRAAGEKAVQSRLTALEERVSGLGQAPVAQTNPPAPTGAQPKQKAAADKNKAKQAEPRTTSRLLRVGEPPGEEKEPGVETGSLPPGETGEPQTQEPPQATQGPVVTFGAPVVTPSKGESKRSTTYGIQIGAGASLDALRGTWGRLVSKHADALAALEPRVFSPRTEGGKYRLVAGPFTSKEEAEKACADMGVGRAGCFSTTFGGEPL